jgi:hypothetical protein
LRRVPQMTQDRPRGFVTKPTIPRTNQVNGSRHLVQGMMLPPRIDALVVDRWGGLIERPCDPTSSSADLGSASSLGAAPRAELLHVLMLPDFERADRIGEFWGYPESRAFAELLIDCEEDRTLRAVLVGMVAGGRRLGWEQRTGTRLRAAALIRANTRVSEFEWSDPEPRSLMYSASGDRGGCAPLS